MRPPSHRLAAVAVAAGIALAGCASAAARTAPRTPVPAIPAPQGPNTPPVTTATTEPAPAPAATPTEAVQRYVTAEAAGDAAASYALLAAADRQRVGSFAAWADEADERLPLRSLATAALDGSTVETEAVLEPRLDDAGFVPARAHIAWRPVHTNAGWFVSPAGTTVTPELPADAAAGPVVAAWLAARSAGTSAGQYDGNLLGRPTLLDALATRAVAPSDVRVDGVRPLADAPDPQVAVNAFGPDASRFVRAVVVDAPERLTVLVAPLGDDWRVVGVDAPG